MMRLLRRLAKTATQTGKVAFLCYLLLAFLRPLNAQTLPVSTTPKASSAVPSAADAPSPTREVIAEGSAAMGAGGVEAARKAAIAAALRHAVEKAAGVYVSARTLTQNYQLLQDQVMTRTDGFATVGELLHEADEKREVRVQIRAQVSLRPLARQLNALKLTRAWRVRVSPIDADNEEAPLTIRANLEKSLTDAGLVLVSSDGEADILIVTTLHSSIDDATASVPKPHGTENSNTTPALPALPTLRDELSVRVTFGQTGEVITALTGTGVSHRQEAHEARLEAADAALARLAPQLTDALLLLPAHDFHAVQLVVGKIGSAARAAHFEDALRVLPDVASVTRRRYEAGNGLWELQVFGDAQGDVARDLEENVILRPYGLTVLSQTPVKIIAATDGMAPVFASEKATPPATTTAKSTENPAENAAVNTAKASEVAPEFVPPAPYHGPLLVYDGFDYKAGEGLIGLDGGSGWLAPWHSHGYDSTPTIIANGNLTFGRLKTSGNALLTTSDGPIGNDREWGFEIGKPGLVIYVSMLMRPLDSMNAGHPDTYFSWSVGDTGIGKGGKDTCISLGSGAETYPTRIVLRPNTTYFTVVRITFGESKSLVELWVNPTPGYRLPQFPDARRVGNFTKIDRLGSGTSIRCVFDEYRVGYSYADVAPTY